MSLHTTLSGNLISRPLRGPFFLSHPAFYIFFILKFRKAIMMYGMGKAEAVLKQRMGFEIADLQPRRAALNCRLPVLMIHGKDDDFILPKHSETIFQDYAGEDKRLLLVWNHKLLSILEFLFEYSVLLF